MSVVVVYLTSGRFYRSRQILFINNTKSTVLSTTMI